jgi:group I intron endonuclease
MATNKYTNAKIYRLVNSVDDQFYVGSTCTSLAKRKNNHKNDARKKPNVRVYQHLNQIGWDNVVIELLELYPCGSRTELERRERAFIDEMKPTLNTNLPASHLPEDTKGRKNALYYANHKDEQMQRVSRWKADNQEKLKEYTTEYRAENKEKIQQYQARWRAENRGYMSKYEKNNPEYAQRERERKAKYRMEHREEINARARERQQQKKAMLGTQRPS